MSSARAALEAYLAGRAPAERVVTAVCEAYYRDPGGRGGAGRREALRPVVEVIERAAPGVVRLAGTEAGPGFEVRLAERPFPPNFEVELKRAAEAALARDWERGRGEIEAKRGEPAGLLTRLVGVVRRLFSASR